MFEVLGSELLYFILRIISVEIIDRSHDRDRDREVRITHKKYFPYYHRRGFLILGDRHPSCVLFTCRSVECHINVMKLRLGTILFIIISVLYHQSISLTAIGDHSLTDHLFIIIIIIMHRLYF